MIASVKRKGLATRLLRAVVWVLVVFLTVVVYTLTVGVPEWMGEKLIRVLNTGRYVVTAERVRIHPLDGILLDSACVFVRGVVGPPYLEAREVAVMLDPVAVVRGARSVRHVVVRDAVCRPAMSGPPAESRARDGRGRNEFDLELIGVEMDELVIRRLSCRVGLGERDVTLSSLRARLSEGEGDSDISGTVILRRDPAVLEARLTTAIDPHVLKPWLERRGIRWLPTLIDRFEFPATPPRVELEFHQRFDGERNLSVAAQGWVHDCRYRGVDVLRTDVRLSIEGALSNRTVRLSPLVLVRPEGLANLDLDIRPGQKRISFDGESTLHPRALTQMIGIFTQSWTTNVVVSGPVRIDAEGVADMANQDRHRMTIAIDGRDIGYRRVVADECTLTVEVRGRTNDVRGIKGRLFGGQLSGSARIVRPPLGVSTGTTFQTDCELDEADFGRVIAAFRPGPTEAYAGRINLRTHFEGPIGPGRGGRVRGNGKLRIRDGRVFMLPVFGGLSKWMARVIPGVDFVLSQGDVTTDFTLTDGRFRSDRVAIEGDVLSLQGKGSYGPEHKLDVDVQVKLSKSDPLVGKLLRLITWPLSKLFEFRLTGTIEEPNWYPVNFSTDLLERIGLRGGKEDAKEE